MAAATVNGDTFVDNPKNVSRVGLSALYFSHLFVAANVDDANDRVNLVSIPAGKTIVAILFTCGDLDAHATPTLDMDLVLSEDGLPSADGTETILYNASTAFATAAHTIATAPVIMPLTRPVKDSTDGNAVLRTKVVAAAATFAAQTLKGLVFVQ